MAKQDHAEHPAHLRHHFDTPAQQFDSAKLGMWLFLATEILLFGGLFCAYAIYRANHPEIFIWSHHLLDTRLGAINTVVLLTSSLTMAWGVRAAQLGQRRLLVLMLSLTLLGAFGFLGIKYVEYESKWKHGLLWGNNFKPDEHYLLEQFGGALHGEPGAAEDESEDATPVGDATRGRALYLGSCYSCHGIGGEGIAKQGASLLSSAFVAEQSDTEALAFLKQGRQPFHAASTMNLLMPPRGGNPTLNDEKLVDIIAYVRELQAEYVAAGGAIGTEVADEALSAIPDAVATTDGTAEEFVLQRSIIPPAPVGPAGRASTAVQAQVDAIPQPENVQIFFGIYFLMTGLHGVHVLVGMALIGWLLRGAIKGRFGPEYFTPVDLGGLYWHLVDLIWIFLFPLLYLIH